MEDFIIEYYKRMKEYLVKANSDDCEIDSLDYEIEQLKEDYFNETGINIAQTESEYEEEKCVWGLFTKYDRLHGQFSHFVERDIESLLAIKIDLGFDLEEPQCPYNDGDSRDIQRAIIDFINQKFKTPEDELEKPIRTGTPLTKLSQKQISFIVDNLVKVSHLITDYVDHYDDGSWSWKTDILFIVQYVFEKAAELTYRVAKRQSTDKLSFDIRESFSYFQLSVPDTFQMKLDAIVDKFQTIVLDLISFIEKNDYNLCDKETWFRPIIFNIALQGLQFTLEQKI